LLTFVAVWTKVRRLAGRDPPVLQLIKNKIKDLRSPDPPGSRLTFFARPKESKQRNGLWYGS